MSWIWQWGVASSTSSPTPSSSSCSTAASVGKEVFFLLSMSFAVNYLIKSLRHSRPIEWKSTDNWSANGSAEKGQKTIISHYDEVQLRARSLQILLAFTLPTSSPHCSLLAPPFLGQRHYFRLFEGATHEAWLFRHLCLCRTLCPKKTHRPTPPAQDHYAHPPSTAPPNFWEFSGMKSVRKLLKTNDHQHWQRLCPSLLNFTPILGFSPILTHFSSL